MNFWDFADKHSDGIFFVAFMLCWIIVSIVESICARNTVEEEEK